MNQYDKQAENFLTKTGAKIEARYLKTGKHFPEDKEERDIYEIKITRGSREFIFNFGESINNTENRKKQNAIGCGDPYGMMHETLKRTKEKKWLLEAQQWQPAGTGTRPRVYSILACLTNYDPGDDVDEFAAEFGYTKPSQAIRAFEAVKNEWHNVKMLFTDDEIQELAEIV